MNNHHDQPGYACCSSEGSTCHHGAAAWTMAGLPKYTSETYHSDLFSERALMAAEVALMWFDAMELRLRYADKLEGEGERAADAWLTELMTDRVTAQHINSRPELIAMLRRRQERGIQN
ncbi:hypothetical protein [Rhodococcus sp. 311R]|uniref:hypothetical protein n=1 Tax=Rhodococcus sp. 311R TaxID=1617904 RepID=UPI000AEDE30E|nr:hypothetical protein [Rhodococcus sp. 311R]